MKILNISQEDGVLSIKTKSSCFSTGELLSKISHCKSFKGWRMDINGNDVYDFYVVDKFYEDIYLKHLKDANDLKNIQSMSGNYNYDSYMLGLYNGMEMIISIFEEREPNFINSKKTKFINDFNVVDRNILTKKKK